MSPRSRFGQCVIDELVDEDALAVVQARQHRSAFDLDGLDDEDDEERRDRAGRRRGRATSRRASRPEVAARHVVESLHLYVVVVLRGRRRRSAAPAFFFPNIVLSLEAPGAPL